MASYLFPVCLFVVVFTIVSAAPAEKNLFDCPVGELYYKCQTEECVKTCAELKRTPVCPSFQPSCFDPACLCDYGYLRNSAGKCVHEDKCYINEWEQVKLGTLVPTGQCYKTPS